MKRLVQTFTNRKDKLVESSLIILSICFFIVSFVILPITIAKYVSESEINTPAQVAEFIQLDDPNVLKTQTYDINMNPSSTDKVYEYKIFNNGETLVDCTFTVTHTNNLPLDYTWSFGTDNSNADSYAVTINPSETVIVYLTVSWQAGQDSYKYSGEVDYILVDIVCEQAQK